MTQFTKYNDTIFSAFCLHSKPNEVVDKKTDILEKIYEYYNFIPESILFIGFNPAILNCKAKEIFVTEVSDKVIDWLKSNKVKVNTSIKDRSFDCVVAFDEYLTFAYDEEDQKQQIEYICSLSKNLIVTTVKDYKNQDFKEREYSQPAIIKNNSLTAFTEIHDWSTKDKNSWVTYLYQLEGPNLDFCGGYDRRALYFKQLAKFSRDNHASNFLVHKNLMYKSLIKKNYEHVISIQIDA